MTQVDLSSPGLSLVACWSCKGPVAPRALFCSTCGAVQPPGNADHFTRLGLRPGYGLEAADLDRQYFGFQRRLHPDRFASRTAKERALSQQQATALNEAYETLKDPLKRAAYMLRLAGLVLLVNGGIAVYHVGVEQHWWASAVCPASDRRGPVSVADLMAEMNKPAEVHCDQPVWSFHGITMAALNIPFSSLLGLVILALAGRKP